MVLLVEQERLLANEVTLIDDATAYNLPNIGAGYGTVHDYGNVVVPSAGLVIFQFIMYNTVGTPQFGQLRLKIGGTIAWGNGKYTLTGDEEKIYYCVAYLTAGTYDILMEGLGDDVLGEVKLKNFQCGFCKFNDLTGDALVVYSAQLSKTTAVRTTPIGDLAKTTLYISAAATTAGEVTNMENTGEALDNGVDILIDSVQKDWTERIQDGDAARLNAAYGLLVISVTAGSAHTIDITKDDANTVVNISVAACPWLLGTTADYPATQYPFPITALSFPGGSTLYVTLEPLQYDVSKFIGVGKTRGISHGLADDYFSSTTATDLIEFSYTFEVVDVSSAIVVTNGVGGCISHIGVDAR